MPTFPRYYHDDPLKPLDRHERTVLLSDEEYRQTIEELRATMGIQPC